MYVNTSEAVSDHWSSIVKQHGAWAGDWSANGWVNKIGAIGGPISTQFPEHTPAVESHSDEKTHAQSEVD